MISARKDEIADETFVAVDDEVASKFFRLFVVLHELRGGHPFEITPYGLRAYLA